MESIEDARRLCNFFGLQDGRRELRDDEDAIGLGTLMLQSCKDINGKESKFKINPLQLLKEVMARRGEGSDFMRTKMGKLVCGRTPKEDDIS